MKIIKYKKIRNKYRVYFDNDKTVDLFEKIIINNELLLKKEITEDYLKRIIEDNNKESILDISIHYIEIKMRSKDEVISYLKKKGYEMTDIDNTIIKLEKLNLLNDSLYVKSFIIDKINLSNDGPNKIKNCLLNKNIKEDIIDKYMNEIDNSIIFNKLDKLIDKKIKVTKNISGNPLKYKLLTYFINQGYDKEMIEEILNKKNLKNDNGYKEYVKLYNKYSRKYEGYELENIIRQKLYLKGYDLSEIKKNID